MICRTRVGGAWWAVAGLTWAACVAWQATPARAHGEEGDDPDTALLKKIGFDQRLNQQVPLDIPLRDEKGNVAPLSSYLGAKPVLLQMIFYRCSQRCYLDLDTMTESLREVKFTAGQQFNVVTLSIDPTDTPAIAAGLKNHYVKKYGRDSANQGWHFLTADKASIDKLAAAVGYRYAYDARKKEYGHPDGAVILTPTGKVARYFFNFDYPARDLRFGLMDAAQNRIGSPLDYVAWSCYHYDPETGKYTLSLMNLVRGAAIVTVCGIVLMVTLLARGERKRLKPRGLEIARPA